MSYHHFTIDKQLKDDGLKSSQSREQICGRYQLEQKQMVVFKLSMTGSMLV